MRANVWERCIDEAYYIIEHNATLRDTASFSGCSKSTVHKDMTEMLPMIKPLLASRVSKVLEKNKEECHIRGGEATRQRYMFIAKK